MWYATGTMPKREILYEVEFTDEERERARRAARQSRTQGRPWKVEVDDAGGLDLTVEREDGWSVSYRVIPQEGVPTVAEVHITRPGAKMPPGGLTTRFLRELRMSEDLAELRHAILAEKIAHDLIHWNFSLEGLSRQPGRRGHPPLWYAERAAEYVEVVAKGSTRPIVELAQKWGYQPSGAREIVFQCREKGMLTGSPPGRSGGDLTEAARVLLVSAAASRPKRKRRTQKRQKERSR